MEIKLDFWNLVLLLVAFFGCVWAFGAVLLKQFEKRLDERFAAQEKIRDESRLRWETRFDELGKSREQLIERIYQVEMNHLQLQARLPNEYVRREDWIRFAGVIDSKLDHLATKIDNVKEKINVAKSN